MYGGECVGISVRQIIAWFEASTVIHMAVLIFCTFLTHVAVSCVADILVSLMPPFCYEVFSGYQLYKLRFTMPLIFMTQATNQNSCPVTLAI
jgi:hypothetical protein